MKKFSALALAIVMMMAISIPALAEQIDIGNDFDKSLPYEQGNIDVLVRLDTDGDGTPDIDDEYPNDEDQIYVALSWENIEFVYNNANESWEDLDNFISVSNQSGIAVTAAFSYTDNLDNEADYDVDFTVREVPVEDPETSETYMSPRIYKAEFDADNNIATLERGLEDTSYADIAVNLAEGAVVPEEDSKVAVGYITVAIAAVSIEPEQEWNEMPIDLYNHYTTEDVALDAEIETRANYYITTSFNFDIALNADDSTAYEITNIEGEYLDGYSYCQWQFEPNGEIINMCSAEGIYNLKITVQDANTDEIRYAYLLIKQDFIN